MSTIEKRAQLESLMQEAHVLLLEIQADEAICPHEWNEPTVETYTVQEFKSLSIPREFGGCDVSGGYREVTKNRWRRACSLCGKVQTTTRSRPAAIIPVFEPQPEPLEDPS